MLWVFFKRCKRQIWRAFVIGQPSCACLEVLPATLLTLAEVGRFGSRQEAHEGIARIQHVLAHNDGSLDGVSARHSPDEEIVLRM